MKPMITSPNNQMTAKLSFMADLRFLAVAQTYIREMAKIAGYPEREILHLELAVEEALVNIVQR